MNKLIELVNKQLADREDYLPSTLTLRRADLKEAYYGPDVYGWHELSPGKYLFVSPASLPNIRHNLQMQDCFIFRSMDDLLLNLSIDLLTITETAANETMFDVIKETIPIRKSHAHFYIDWNVQQELNKDLCIAYAVLASWTIAEEEIHRQAIRELIQISHRPELRVDLPEKLLPQPSIVSLISYLSESTRYDSYRLKIPKVPLYPDPYRYLFRHEEPCVLLPVEYYADIGLVRIRDHSPELIDRILESCILLPYESTPEYAPMMSFWPSSLHFFIKEEAIFDIWRDSAKDGLHVKCTIYYGFYFLEDDIKVIPNISEALEKLAT